MEGRGWKVEGRKVRGIHFLLVIATSCAREGPSKATIFARFQICSTPPQCYAEIYRMGRRGIASRHKRHTV
jgi:hypothetical protein